MWISVDSAELEDTSKGMKKKILLGDNNLTVRAGIRSLLKRLEYVGEVAEAENEYEVVSMTEELRPDVAILDIGLVIFSYIDTIRQIRMNSPKTEVIILSMYTEKWYVLEMIKAGAKAYVLKDQVKKDLSPAIQAVCANQYYVSSDVYDDEIQEYIASKQKG